MKQLSFKSIVTVAIMLLFFNGVKAQVDQGYCPGGATSSQTYRVDFENITTNPTYEPGDGTPGGSTGSTYDWSVSPTGPGITENQNEATVDWSTATPGQIYTITVKESRSSGASCDNEESFTVYIPEKIGTPVISPFCLQNGGGAYTITGTVDKPGVRVDLYLDGSTTSLGNGTSDLTTTTPGSYKWSITFTPATPLSNSSRIKVIAVDTKSAPTYPANTGDIPLCSSDYSSEVSPSQIKTSAIQVKPQP